MLLTDEILKGLKVFGWVVESGDTVTLCLEPQEQVSVINLYTEYRSVIGLHKITMLQILTNRVNVSLWS